MKNKLLRLIFMLSRFTLYGMVLQACFLQLLLAADGKAQRYVSAKDVHIAMDMRDATLGDVLRNIESKTDFRFTYDKKDVNENLTINIKTDNQSVADILIEVSRQTRLRFKQVNNVISVQKNNLFSKGASMEIVTMEKTITGRVTDENTEGLPGVNILLKNTTIGTVTDIDGNYRISVPDDAAILVFSSVGYETEEITIGNQTVINVQMIPDVQALSEIVVIGYGEKSRKLLTESIGTIDAQEITKVPVAAADQALQGRISGVQVTNVDGTPGSPVAIRIRGVGTVGNTQPLFVIDGIPVGNNTSSTTNPLATINPSDIESISVLKDASAAAVYGVRAANGVVLITTKRGEQGKPRINFDGYYGVQKLPDLWDMNNTQQYIGLTQEAYDAYNLQNNLAPDDEAFLMLHPDLQSGSPYRDRNTDWVDDALNQNAPIQNYNLAVSGANEDLNYHVSAGYFKQEATIKKWDLERFTFRANGDYKVGNRFTFGQTFSLSYQEVIRGMNGGGDGFLLRNAATMPPFFQIYDTENEIPGNRYGYHGNLDVGGLTIGNQNGINHIVENYDRTTRMLGGIYGELEIINGLRFKSAASIDLSLSRGDSWSPGYLAPEMGLDRANNNFNDSRGEGSTQVFTNMLSYDNSFGDHTISALAGIEYQKIRSTSLSGRAEDFLSADPAFYRVVKNGRASHTIGGGAGEDAFVGYIGRLSYDFANKYLLTFTVRRDGTARFSPEGDRRWGTFPSVSAAWRLGEEEFFQNVPFVSDLKIRGSWGQLGNANTLAFPHIFRVSVTPDYGLNGSTTIQAPAPVNFVNQDVTWETVTTTDLGVDVSFFNDRVSLLATYYRRETEDFLIYLPIPNISGFSSTPTNAGTVLNTGIELELGYNTSFTNGLGIDISANFTTVDNEITSLSPGIEEFVSTGQYRTGIGYPIGYFYGYQTDGIYQTDAEAAAALPDASSPQGPRAGDIRFVDNNGPAPEDAPEGQQFSGEPDGEVDFNDRTYLGKTIPDFYYGLNINANFKGFDLSLLFQGVGGVQLYNEFRAAGESLTGGGRNLLATTANRWTGPGTSNSMPRAVQTDPNSNNRFSERWVEDAGFFRMRNLQLGYSIPESVLDNVGFIQNLRIYLGATNLFTITDYSGLDPEVMTYRSNGNQIGQDAVGNPPSGGAGTDSGNIPQPKTYQLGFQFQF